MSSLSLDMLLDAAEAWRDRAEQAGPGVLAYVDQTEARYLDRFAEVGIDLDDSVHGAAVLAGMWIALDLLDYRQVCPLAVSVPMLAPLAAFTTRGD